MTPRSSRGPVEERFLRQTKIDTGKVELDTEDSNGIFPFLFYDLPKSVVEEFTKKNFTVYSRDEC